jgi:hypothetical protein
MTLTKSYYIPNSYVIQNSSRRCLDRTIREQNNQNIYNSKGSWDDILKWDIIHKEPNLVMKSNRP